MSELAKKYSHLELEQEISAHWQKQKPLAFSPQAKPFTIVLPPPNVTGDLHLGHAWDGAIQDLLVRFKRLNGYKVAFIPGMDHAGIATQVKFEKLLKQQKQSREQLGKELFLEELNNPITNILLPIVADLSADPEFGTGIVKVTPAHDQTDFEIGQRHGFKPILAIGPNGKMLAVAQEFVGIDRLLCRQQLIDKLTKNGSLVETKIHLGTLSRSERTGDISEMLLSEQWFIKMQPLAKLVLKLQNTKDATRFSPPRFAKSLKQ
ncbi:unnamed protein product [Didymodactylos carnosus]|uniref:valine--tRNA ligase n=1 Tax=Didymodactylos carnosus TaxID=1234261 RepID=A0A8S2HAU8_9BILA|nr:unnamed protein product [Didymodactylos carnosus]CAF3623093.1 unnamed protein product [Didymodactylos carnosus]